MRGEHDRGGDHHEVDPGQHGRSAQHMRGEHDGSNRGGNLRDGFHDRRGELVARVQLHGPQVSLGGLLEAVPPPLLHLPDVLASHHRGVAADHAEGQGQEHEHHRQDRQHGGTDEVDALVACQPLGPLHVVRGLMVRVLVAVEKAHHGLDNRHHHHHGARPDEPPPEVQPVHQPPVPPVRGPDGLGCEARLSALDLAAVLLGDLCLQHGLRLAANDVGADDHDEEDDQ
mmetsp:Transcript_19317/g.54510  ORF Transcript_19317/g.54510 Transcript_19317/m.54510 type:complete len:228 (+) Transcript_19317:543-1226(+)